MEFEYDLSVFIARLQPLHEGHLTVIRQGLIHSKNMVVLIGSSGGPRSHRNPFTYREREKMLLNSVPANLRDRITILPLEDVTYNETRWIQTVQTHVERTAWKLGYTTSPSIALIGHSKDSSSYYLKMFPQWSNIEVQNYKNINSTVIRNSYFSNIGHMWLSDCDGHKEGDLPQDKSVPTEVRSLLSEFFKTDSYKNISDEYEFVRKYRAGWASAPYEPVFVTGDACVVQSGHVLLVKRREIPGKGQWALPGGFINQNEKINDAIIRELREETGIKVPEAVLRGSVVCTEVFDDPRRSSRGRTITHCSLIKLRDDVKLPKVKGGDDAEKAKFVEIGKINMDEMFEDHFHIIHTMLAKV